LLFGICRSIPLAQIAAIFVGLQLHLKPVGFSCSFIDAPRGSTLEVRGHLLSDLISQHPLKSSLGAIDPLTCIPSRVIDTLSTVLSISPAARNAGNAGFMNLAERSPVGTHGCACCAMDE
jgi:hypothetical protein